MRRSAQDQVADHLAWARDRAQGRDATLVLPAACPPTEVGGYVPAVTPRVEQVTPMREAVIDWTNMCWAPVPGADPWRLCMLPRLHDKSCLPVPPSRGLAVR